MNAATIDERRKHGQSCRTKVHRIAQGTWDPQTRSFDPVAALLAANRGRLKELLPVKWARMAVSPSGFFRGAPSVMAADLACLPVTGLLTQICGDAHVRNFGAYAAPDGHLTFDINDFDETIRGPWEWDIKRMAASLVLAGRDSGNPDQHCNEAVLSFVRCYRESLEQLSQLSYLDLARFQVQRVSHVAALTPVLRKAARSTPLQTLEKLTVPGRRHRMFREQAPVTTRVSPMTAKKVIAALKSFRRTLPDDRRNFFDRYRPIDVVFKVVGTSSVGTRDYVLLFQGNGPSDPLFLQVKEELHSVYEPYLRGAAKYRNQGQRVVEGQRRMQSLSDIFLGWTSMDGRDYLVRQYKDHKASINPQELTGPALLNYARVCGELLAKGHARAGDACAIAGYCGRGTKLDHAIAKFAVGYADQTLMDYKKFVVAIRAGKLPIAHS